MGQAEKTSSAKKRKRRAKSLTRRHLKNTLRYLPFAGPLIITAFIYTWQHTRLNIVGLPIESLRAKRTEIVKQNDSIRLRIEKLQAPQRIEAIAHEKLGMSLPQTWQVVALDQPMEPPQPNGETSR
ncbi:MAG: cell division protein FtsL, partial [Candidatus Lindowbacteria bacterium]|nr:cell division protein FtsL [Candidatus Lindowbacteria bacterium]